ncbi:MAG: hypothetical protein DCC58_18625 [Chloroflexi bacterium]|nr:MAG: hypothetical protein DCC58_18625 [Chloroflexota bacterium]
MVRVAFHSNHCLPEGPGEQLRVRVATDGRSDELTFSLPKHYHVHNDLVATALLALVGRTYPVVEFNFPISQRCADTLLSHYQLAEIGPVDPTLEPRQPGRYVGLNFSGGADSTAAWVLLREVFGDDVRVLTSQYWDADHWEVCAARTYAPDVICATNLRQLGYDKAGRFNNAVPLLFADYLDLWGIATGHNFEHYYPLTYVFPRPGGLPPAFIESARSFSAGGLEEVHILRSLSELGIARLLVEFVPERIPLVLQAVAPVRSDKRATRIYHLRKAFLCAGQRPPDYLLRRPQVSPRYNANSVVVWGRGLRVARWFGPAEGALVNGFIATLDPAEYAGLDVDFYERYHPYMLSFAPDELRRPLAAVFHRAGILPMNERDHAAMDAVHAYLQVRGPLSLQR